MNRYLVALCGLVLLSGFLLLWHLWCLGRRAWGRHWADAQMLRKFEEMSPKDVSEACQRAGINFEPGVLRRFAWQNPYLVGRMFGTLYFMINEPCLKGWNWAIDQSRPDLEKFFVQEILDLPSLARQWFNVQRFSEGLSHCGCPFRLPARLAFALEEKRAEKTKARRKKRK